MTAITNEPEDEQDVHENDLLARRLAYRTPDESETDTPDGTDIALYLGEGGQPSYIVETGQAEGPCSVQTFATVQEALAAWDDVETACGWTTLDTVFRQRGEA